MPEINLTSRKTAPARTISSHYYDDATGEYTGKFSAAYQEAGHDYTKSFKVLQLAYLFKYHVLTFQDTSVYGMLQLLCERGIKFTLERLSEELGMGKSTLRQCLDNLENAELLEIVKDDGQGQGNFYILRTPYFERDSIVGDSDAVVSRQDRILYDYDKKQKKLVRSNRELPDVFIEDVYLRLKKQVTENRARRLRDVARDKELQKQNPAMAKEVRENAAHRQLTWNKIIKKIGNSKAATFDNLIFQLIQKFENIEATSFWQIFKARLKKLLEESGISSDPFLLDYGVELGAFYDSRRAEDNRKRPPAATAKPPSSAGSATAPNDQDEEREFLIKILESEKAGKPFKGLNDTFDNFVRTLKRVREHLTLAEIESLAIGFVAPQKWQKLSNELRN